jgi:hypothetical protein
VLRLEQIAHRNDVRVLDLAHDLDLALQILLVVGAQVLLADHFDGDLGFCSRLGQGEKKKTFQRKIKE